MTHRLTIPIPPGEWISANDRMHWAEKAKRTKALRARGKAYARALGLHRAGLEVVHVAAWIGYPRGGKADPANAGPTVKALIDGLTDAGVWPDDDSEHVIGPDYRRGPVTGRAGWHEVQLVLTPQGIPW